MTPYSFISVLALIIVSGFATEVPFASFGFTKATILSGGLTNCVPSPNVSSCSGGIASARFVFRNHTKSLQSLNTEFIFSFDKDSAFVQMHPFDYTVNIVAMREFGIRYYFAEPAMIPNRDGRRAFELFYNDDVQMLQANTYVPTGDDWYGFINRQALFFDNKIGLAIVGQSVHANALPSIDVLPSVIRYLRPRAKVVVVVFNDASTTGPAVLAKLRDNPPDVFLDLLVSSHQPCRLIDNTQYCGSNSAATTLNMLHIYLDANQTALTKVVAQTELISNLYANPALDADYYADQLFLKGEAEKASAFDPIVGNSTVNMPSGGVWDNTYPCYVDECGQAVLNAKALMYNNPDADIAFGNSGGFRGKGWPAGNIRMSNIWEMIPYANTLVSTRVLGYKIWQIMNISLYYFPQVSVFDSVAERFILGAGYEVEFDATKPRFSNRLLGIKIQNRKTGVFEPLERTRYYTIATDNFMYQLMPMIAPILQKQYRGESVIFPFGTKLRQTVLGDYLTATSPYTTLRNNQIIFDHSGSRQAMDWFQTPNSCSTNQYWDEGIVSCISCAEGFVVSNTRDGCVSAPVEADYTVIIAVVASIGSVLLFATVGAMVVLEYKRRKSARNTDSAPKSGENISIIFSDIQSSTKLWGTVPASMADALEVHHRIIRDCISQYGAYEVKTIGDSFMIACGSAENAVRMSIQIQEQLFNQQWPTCINSVYACEGKENEADLLDEVDDDPKRLTTVPGEGGDITVTEKVQHNGLRVRIGLHCGPAEAIFDEISKGYDYYGPSVNLASRIEAAAQGGQILTSRSTANMLPSSEAFIVEFFAEAQLQGIQGMTELLQITTSTLQLRKYNPKNISSKAILEDDSSKETGSMLRGGSDNGEQASMGSHQTFGGGNGELLHMCRGVLLVALRLLNKKAKAETVRILSKAWHVQAKTVNAKASYTDGNELDETIGQIAFRVMPALRRHIQKGGLKTVPLFPSTNFNSSAVNDNSMSREMVVELWSNGR